MEEKVKARIEHSAAYAATARPKYRNKIPTMPTEYGNEPMPLNLRLNKAVTATFQWVPEIDCDLLRERLESFLLGQILSIDAAGSTDPTSFTVHTVNSQNFLEWDLLRTIKAGTDAFKFACTIPVVSRAVDLWAATYYLSMTAPLWPVQSQQLQLQLQLQLQQQPQQQQRQQHSHTRPPQPQSQHQQQPLQQPQTAPVRQGTPLPLPRSAADVDVDVDVSDNRAVFEEVRAILETAAGIFTPDPCDEEIIEDEADVRFPFTPIERMFQKGRHSKISALECLKELRQPWDCYKNWDKQLMNALVYVGYRRAQLGRGAASSEYARLETLRMQWIDGSDKAEVEMLEWTSSTGEAVQHFKADNRLHLFPIKTLVPPIHTPVSTPADWTRYRAAVHVVHKLTETGSLTEPLLDGQMSKEQLRKLLVRSREANLMDALCRLSLEKETPSPLEVAVSIPWGRIQYPSGEVDETGAVGADRDLAAQANRIYRAILKWNRERPVGERWPIGG
ncbi:hypothetical protein YB2330_005484 [Saitoella coloradoensis]